MANPILISGAAGRVGDLVNDSGVRFHAVLTTGDSTITSIERESNNKEGEQDHE